ncbi:uncharacterized protein [Leptinotarsa decemlineata]|uniref:uncharacterized protein n=1 Tax=Leptinotarsa decemlineata TaxID=7539 RepID=UPI000C253A87|nr:zinc finger protein OZF-like [Leptinotarsa decemlineata]
MKHNTNTEHEIIKQEYFPCEEDELSVNKNTCELIVKTEEDTLGYEEIDYKIDISKLEVEYHDVEVKSEVESENNQDSRPKNPFLQSPKKKNLKVYKCEVCFRDLATPALKKSHFNSHFDKYIVCFGCGKSFTKKHEYLIHCIHHYVKKPLLRCRTCSKVFSTKAALKKHLARCKHVLKPEVTEKNIQNHSFYSKKCPAKLGRYHKATKLISCPVCSKPFTTTQRMQFHQRTHSADNSSFLCEVCLECFPNFRALRQHRSSHIGNLFRCAVCSFSFLSKLSLEKHLITHREKPFRCKVCSKNFSGKKNLQTHERIHSANKQFQCKVCLKRFSQGCNLRAHLISHTGQRRHQCSVCSHYFTTKQSLRRHAETHDGEKSFHCSKCSKSFFYQFNLNRHMKNHAPAKKCQFCSRVFSMNHRLKAHERTHTGEKPFSCDVCGRSFSDSSHLWGHKKTHTGEKQFQCEFCLKRYARKRYMMVHRKTCKQNPFKDS